MLNQIVLVGRIAADPELKEVDNGKTVSNLRLAVPRSFKNENGEYDTDFLDVTLWNGVAQNTAEYCKKGDIVGVKGRMQNNIYEKEDGKKEYKMNIIAEKVTFLSSRSEPEHAR